MSEKRLDNIEKILERVESKLERNSKLIEKNSRLIENNSKLIEKNSELIERVVLKVVDMEQYMKEELVTKDEFNNKVDGLYVKTDGIAGKLKVYDSELAANVSRHDRLEDRMNAVEQLLKV